MTIHPDVREWAGALARRRPLSQLFEDLVESERLRYQVAAQSPDPHEPPTFHYPVHPAYHLPQAASPQQ